MITAPELITNQGGVAHEATNRLERFLILGSDKNTFYATSKELTIENIQFLKKELDAGRGLDVVNTIVRISDSGRAPSNEPALLALAFCGAYKNDKQQAYAQQVRQYALARLDKVARTSTHLFHFLTYSKALGRGWGVAFKTAVQRWYLNKSELALVNQLTKYQARDGWSHADVLWLAHPRAEKPFQDIAFSYATQGMNDKIVGETPGVLYLQGVEAIKNETDIDTIVRLIQTYEFPFEVIPTEARTSPRVWEALVPTLGYTAMLRNLATMSRVGYLTQGSDGATTIRDRILNVDDLRRARIHPIDLLKAKLTYQNGKGFRGTNTWQPVTMITNALEEAFYASFQYVQPSNKRILFGLDVSSSMKNPANMMNVPGMSPRVASAVLALALAKTEPNYEVVAFSHNLVNFPISQHDSLDTVVRNMEKIPFGATRCDLPMQYAMENKLLFDAFMIFTDSETGGVNPSKMLTLYREASGIENSKLIVNAMVANRVSIADPNDPNMLDVAGFSSDVPAVVSLFLAS